jgi:hypothetical protein
MTRPIKQVVLSCWVCASRRALLGVAALIGATSIADAAPPTLPAASNPLHGDAIAAEISQAPAPDDYILSKFARADVVLLGEDHAIRQHLAFVAELIPDLHAAGVRNLVMEFGATEDQAALDALLAAPVYDQETARRLMFRYNTMWSWKEYRNLYRAAWAFNRALAPGDRPFRIINMSYIYDWRGYTGATTPQDLKRVFPRGVVDAFRADIIAREILDRGEKALVLTGTLHAFTRSGMPQTQSDSDGFCLRTYNALGNRLFRDHGSRISNIMFHQALPSRPGGAQPFVQPGGGEIERLMRANGKRAVGFDLRGAAAGRIREGSYYGLCDEDLTLADLFDGYLFLAPFESLEAATPDPAFLDADNIAKAIEQFPNPDWNPKPRNLGEAQAHMLKMAKEIDERYAEMAKAQ